MTHEEKIEKWFDEWKGPPSSTPFFRSDLLKFAAYCLEQREREKKEIIWIPFDQPTYDMFNVMASRNCLCKFDDGTIIPYNENHPMAEMTHFEYKP